MINSFVLPVVVDLNCCCYFSNLFDDDGEGIDSRILEETNLRNHAAAAEKNLMRMMIYFRMSSWHKNF